MLFLKWTHCLPPIHHDPQVILFLWRRSWLGEVLTDSVFLTSSNNKKKKLGALTSLTPKPACPMYFQTLENRHFYLFWIPFLGVDTQSFSIQKQRIWRTRYSQCLHPGLHMVNTACHSRQNRWLQFSAACLPDRWIIAAGLIMQRFISIV